LLLVWWLAVHVLAVAALVLAGWPWYAKAAGALAALVHGFARRPVLAPPVLTVASDDRWSVPARGLDGLVLEHGTRFTSYWALLRLRGPAVRLDVLLVADHLDAATWRRLQARLRRQRSAAPAEPARSERAGTRDLR
jgi:hypothetical protein